MSITQQIVTSHDNTIMQIRELQNPTAKVTLHRTAKDVLPR